MRKTVQREGHVATVLSVLVWMLLACTPEPKPPLAPGVVAQIDSVRITADALRTFVAEIPPSLRYQGQGSEVRQRYLRSLLAKHLLLAEARERRIDTLDAVQTKVMPRWRQHLIASFRRVALAPMAQVSEAEIDSYITWSGLDRRREMAGILVKEEDTARQIQAKLKAGGDFAPLAEEYTIDKRSAAQGGVLGLIDLEQARKLQIPDEVFVNLPVGQASDILPMGKHYQIVQFLRDEPVVLHEKQRQQVQRLIYERKLMELEGVEINKLVHKLKVRTVGTTVQALLEKKERHTRIRRTHLSAEEDSLALFAYTGGRITLGDYLGVLWTDSRALSGWGVRDSTEIVDTARELLLVPAMLAIKAQQAGFEERAEDRQWLEAVRQEFMIKQLRQEEIIDKAEATRGEAKDFYDENEHLFRDPVEFTVAAVEVEDPADAAPILQAVRQGASLVDLAGRPDMQPVVELRQLAERERLTHPLLYKAVAAARLDQVVGPVPVKNGYCVFQVIDRKGGELQPFFQVVDRASAFVRGQKRESLFEALIDDLMDKHEDAITVSDVELAAALSDSFLHSLAVLLPNKRPLPNKSDE